ncbi:hypothetical protein [Dongia sp.]
MSIRRLAFPLAFAFLGGLLIALENLPAAPTLAASDDLAHLPVMYD